MNETLWLLLVLFGFAVVAQTLAHIFTLRRSLRELEEEVAESTQTIFESRRKNEWLEARVQDHEASNSRTPGRIARGVVTPLA